MGLWGPDRGLATCKAARPAPCLCPLSLSSPAAVFKDPAGSFRRLMAFCASPGRLRPGLCPSHHAAWPSGRSSFLCGSRYPRCAQSALPRFLALLVPRGLVFCPHTCGFLVGGLGRPRWGLRVCGGVGLALVEPGWCACEAAGLGAPPGPAPQPSAAQPRGSHCEISPVSFCKFRRFCLDLMCNLLCISFCVFRTKGHSLPSCVAQKDRPPCQKKKKLISNFSFQQSCWILIGTALNSKQDLPRINICALFGAPPVETVYVVFGFLS